MKTGELIQRYYYRVPSFVDGTTEFHWLIRKHCRDAAEILEVGAGPTNPTSAMLATLGKVTGIDISPEVHENVHVSKSYVCDGRRFPFEDGSFDACVSNYVLEHLAEPEEHFREVARVLKPGAPYCFRTPNKWHYVALAARILPHWVHLKLSNRLRGLGREAHDPYPTFYRANSRSTLRRLCKQAGFASVELAMIEKEPSYGVSSVFLPFLADDAL